MCAQCGRRARRGDNVVLYKDGHIALLAEMCGARALFHCILTLVRGCTDYTDVRTRYVSFTLVLPNIGFLSFTLSLAPRMVRRYVLGVYSQNTNLVGKSEEINNSCNTIVWYDLNLVSMAILAMYTETWNYLITVDAQINSQRSQWPSSSSVTFSLYRRPFSARTTTCHFQTGSSDK